MRRRLMRLDALAPGGGGVPIVLLHGALRSPRAWDGVARRLAAAGRRVVLVDDPQDVRRSPPDAADELATLLHERAHLVGHSRGATVASWVAVDSPEVVASLTVICSPPHVTEVFRAHFRDAGVRELADIAEDAWPTMALRRFRGAALVIEAEDDPLYSPTHTLFWRAYLPYAAFERVPGGHEFFAESDEKEAWLAERVLSFAAEAERGG